MCKAHQIFGIFFARYFFYISIIILFSLVSLVTFNLFCSFFIELIMQLIETKKVSRKYFSW